MMECQVCQQNHKAPYRCPQCRIKYCSASCFGKHKASDTCGDHGNSTATPAVAKEDLSVQTRLPIELGDDEETDRVPAHVLERIGQSAEVLQLLKNRHLRAMINMVDRSTDPAEDMQKAMMEPIFVQLVDQLLAIAEHREK